MKTLVLSFTLPQKNYLLHRLEQWDLFEQVFADTEGLEHLADQCEERIKELLKELEHPINEEYNIWVDPKDDLDEQILLEAIQGNTYYAVCEPYCTAKEINAVAKMMTNTANKIEETFGYTKGSIKPMFY